MCTKRKAVALLLSLSLLMYPVTAFGVDDPPEGESSDVLEESSVTYEMEDVHGLFARTAEERGLLESLAKTYDWDLSLFADYRYQMEIGEEEVSLERNGYEAEYLAEQMGTFLQYLGRTEMNRGYGSYGGFKWNGGAANEILRIATSYLGVKEDNGHNECDIIDIYCGDPVGSRIHSGDAYAWCAMFISVCANQAGLIEDGTFPYTSWADDVFEFMVKKGYEYYSVADCTPFGGESYTPVPGDVFLTIDPDNPSAGYAHVGLLLEVGEDYIMTIEGNKRDAVVSDKVMKGDDPGFDQGFIISVPYPSGGINYVDENGIEHTGNEVAIFNYLAEKGISTAAIAGILANMDHESDFSTGALGDYENGKPTSFGICQWHLGRYDRLVSWCGRNGYDHEGLEGQLEYLWWELAEYYPGVLKSIAEAGDTEDDAYNVAYTWCVDFESPQFEHENGIKRGDLAKKYLQKYREYLEN